MTVENFHITGKYIVRSIALKIYATCINVFLLYGEERTEFLR